ncbi:MAG: HAMP domain-containing histidine kinase [Myxococcales bacterium]|nr:HAMP domain-containing histidine kinase [Myxococcales bacterium]
MNRRPARLTLLALGIALPTVLLGAGWFTASLRERAMQAAAQRQRLQRSAAAIRAAVDESLEDLRRRENARPFYLYNHYYSPPELLALNDPIAVSPLAAAPDDRRVRGYFQVDPGVDGDGYTIRTPYTPHEAAPTDEATRGEELPAGTPAARASEMLALVTRESFADIRGLSFGDAGSAPGRMPSLTDERTLVAQAVQQAPLTTNLNQWSNYQQQDIVEAQRGDPLASARVQQRGRQAPVTSRNELSWGELEQQQVKQRAAPQSSYGSSSSNRRDDAAREQPVGEPETQDDGNPYSGNAFLDAQIKLPAQALRPEPPSVAPGPAQVVDYTPMRFTDVGGVPVLVRVVSHAGTGSVQGVILDGDYIERDWLPALLERHALEDDGPAPTLTRAPEGCALALPISANLPGLQLCYAEDAAARDGHDTSLALQTGILLGLLSVIATAGVAINRASRRAEELAAQRAAFVSAVSHELRTPLTTVRMHAEMLREGLVAPERRARVHEELTRESVRLSRLIDNVLTVSRLEAGRHTLERSEGDLAAFMERVAEGQQSRIERAGFELRVRVPDAPLMSCFDGQAVEQIIVNLVDNALKYAQDADHPEIELEARAGPRDAIELHVRDRGPGIPESARARVFDRFFRVQRPEDAHLPGTGLGLALVRDLARAHGGEARVDARPGGGADFCVTLPRDAPD